VAKSRPSVERFSTSIRFVKRILFSSFLSVVPSLAETARRQPSVWPGVFAGTCRMFVPRCLNHYCSPLQEAGTSDWIRVNADKEEP